jgi:hypothetical protein
MKTQFAILAAAAVASACTHRLAVDDITVRNQTIQSGGAAAYAERKSIAAETCEAQYEEGRQNYLAAVETRIGAAGAPDATKAPLDSFRAEINAAYNAVVMRCKTHMHCLEVQNYDEAKCYMAASDRKDAERRFSDLSEDLRRIEKKKQGKSPKPKSAPPVTVTTTVNQGAVQTQSNTAQTGDTIEDQDVLVMCGNAKNLLNARCRQPCRERCD